MEVVKKTSEYTVFKKRSGRFGVQNKEKKWVNGDEKVKILLDESLIKAPTPKKPEAPAAEEPKAEEPKAEEAKAEEEKKAEA